MLDDWRLTDTETFTRLVIEPVSCPRTWLLLTRGQDKVVSAVGHADTAAVFSKELGEDVEFNRISLKFGEEFNRISLKFGESDVLLVGQLTGPRLPEGSTTLPEGATISWLAVYIEQ